MVGNSYPESLISLFCNLLPLNFFSFIFSDSVLPAVKDGMSACARWPDIIYQDGACMEAK